MKGGAEARNWLFVLFVLAAGCGGPGPDATGSGAAAARGLVVGPDHGGAGAGWGLSACELCHPLSTLHVDVRAALRLIVEEKGYATCMGCHGDNGTGGPRRCVICHNDADMKGRPHQLGEGAGGYGHNFASGSAQIGPLSDRHCIVCHDSADMDGTFELSTDLTFYPAAGGGPYRHEADFCLRCHNRVEQPQGFGLQGTARNDPLVAMADNYTRIDRHGFVDGTGTGIYRGLRSGYSYRSVLPCSDCHNVHGSLNRAFIIDDSRSGARGLDAGFRAAAYRVDTRGGDLSTLCVLCHSMETVVDAGGTAASNGLAGVHEVGADCRLCHSHGEAAGGGM